MSESVTPPTGPEYKYAVEVYDDDSRMLLRIGRDGIWEVGPDDAPEAARRFAEAVAQYLAQSKRP